MSDLSPEAQHLLDVARDADEPTRSDRDRVGRALAVSLGVAVVAPAAAQAAATVAGVGALAKTAAAVVVLAAVGAGVGAGVVWRSSRSMPSRGNSPPVVATVVRQADPVPSLVSPAVAPVPVATPPAIPRNPSGSGPVSQEARGTRPVAPGPSTLSVELARLRWAQDALQHGDASRALVLLSAYESDYPHGELRDDGRAMRVFALCADGRRDEARAAAARFVRSSPGSPLVPRVQASCSDSTAAGPGGNERGEMPSRRAEPLPSPTGDPAR